MLSGLRRPLRAIPTYVANHKPSNIVVVRHQQIRTRSNVKHSIYSRQQPGTSTKTPASRVPVQAPETKLKDVGTLPTAQRSQRKNASNQQQQQQKQKQQQQQQKNQQHKKQQHNKQHAQKQNQEAHPTKPALRTSTVKKPQDWGRSRTAKEDSFVGVTDGTANRRSSRSSYLRAGGPARNAPGAETEDLKKSSKPVEPKGSNFNSRNTLQQPMTTSTARRDRNQGSSEARGPRQGNNNNMKQKHKNNNQNKHQNKNTAQWKSGARSESGMAPIASSYDMEDDSYAPEVVEPPVADLGQKNKGSEKWEKKKKFKKREYNSDGSERKERYPNNAHSKPAKRKKAPKRTPARPITVKIPATITLRELGLRSKVKSLELIEKLLDLGELDSSSASSQSSDSSVKTTSPISKYLLARLKLATNRPVRGRKQGKARKLAGQQISAAAESIALSADMSELLLAEFGIPTERVDTGKLDVMPTDREMAILEDDNSGKLSPRPPVVGILGSVDHGKTTLLDSLRKTSVAAGEAGGITQAVSAFEVLVGDDKEEIVFLDTPGHAAFTSMRKTGAMIADILVLVIAASDGVRPQTIEAIEYAKASHLPIIVAMTKVDVPGTSIEEAKVRISNQLLEHEIITTEVGGNTPLIPLAAPTGVGLDALADSILLQAADMELVADTKARGEAIVLESSKDKGLGPVADMVVTWGTFKVGDFIVSGELQTKVRRLLNLTTGKPMKTVTPSIPVRVVGFAEPPTPSSDIIAVESAKRAKEIVQYRTQRRTESEKDDLVKAAALDEAGSEDDGEDNSKRLVTIPIILKGDTDGSLEALKYSIESITENLKEESEMEEIGFKILGRNIGPPSEADVRFAKDVGASIYAFNVRVSNPVNKAARDAHVTIVSHSVIYHLLDDLEKLFDSNKTKEVVTTVLGKAKVLKVFTMSPRNRREGKWIVAGCSVESGTINKKSRLRVVRDGEVIHKSGLDSLQRFKEVVTEVNTGQECGISLSSFQEFEEGDIIESYEES